MGLRRFGIVVIVLALLGGAAWIGWRAGLGGKRLAPPPRSLPVEDAAPARQRLALPSAPSPSPARRRLALPTTPAPATPPPLEKPPAPKDGVTRERVRTELQKAFETKLPSYKLSDEQYERLTDDIMTIRESREKMNALPLTPENAEEHQRLRHQLSKAVGDFDDVAHISLSEFTEKAQPGEGLTKEEDEANESVVPETLPPDPSGPSHKPLLLPRRTTPQVHYGSGTSVPNRGNDRLLPQGATDGSPETLR